MRKCNWVVMLMVVSLFVPVCLSTSFGASEGTTGQGTVTLRMASFMPSYGVSGNVWPKMMETAAKEWEARSNGRIKVEYYWASSLVKTDKMLGGVRTGVADVGDIAPGFFMGELPLQDVTNILYQTKSPWVVTEATKQLNKDFPKTFGAEYARNNIHPLCQTGYPQNIMMTTKYPVNKIEDLKGLKVRCFGYTSWLLEALGATPISLPSMETYQSLNAGTINAVSAQGVTMLLPQKFDEVCHYFIDASMGVYSRMDMVMNLKTWNSLPDDLKKVVEKGTQVAVDQYWKDVVGAIANTIAEFPKRGVHVKYLPDNEIARWREIAKSSVWKRWLKEKESLGLPAREIFNRTMELYEKLESKDPYSGRWQ